MQILKTQWIIDQLCILAWIPDCAFLDVRILGPKRNLEYRSFFSLGRYANKVHPYLFISFFEQRSFNSGVRLLLELFCVIAIKHVAFLTICEKLLVTMAFTFTFVDEMVVSNLKKNMCRMTDLAKKGVDLHTPIHPPPDSSWKKVKFLRIFGDKYLGQIVSETISKNS